MLEYDVIIIGGGPAGLSAGIYAARARLKTLVIEQAITGGQIVLTSEIENYPGFPELQTGFELGQAIEKQAKKFGVEIKQGIVSSVDLKSKTIEFGKENITGKYIVVATGSEPGKLGITGEAEYFGRGVSYCATCDGAFFKDKVVAVIGGGDSAVEEAMYLSKIAAKVYLVHRRDELRAVKIIQEKAFANSKIEFLLSHIPIEIKGDKTVNSIVLQNKKTGENVKKEISGVFFYVGQNPNTGFLKGQCKLNEKGFIVTNEKMETSVDGVYAAGDVRDTVLRQVVTACADGAVAASEIAKRV
ncbi:MAG: thioredoxin-disulfide reductase [Candidatus Margulisiibacteriota bacterium]